ncbi:MAG: Hpt domain-containing protein [Gammaproteobacteria bacterium]|nr:Hpt domain-containing protein [Gammaproteobacteria bacterium]
MTDGLAQNLLDELRQGYITALPSKVEDIELHCLAMEKSDDYAEHYAELYRAVHSLKGSGGTYGYHIISGICHQMEDWLTTLEKCVKLSSSQLDILLAYVDLLRDAISHIQQAETSFQDIEQTLSEIKKRSHQNKLHGLVVDRSSMNAKIIAKILGEDNVQLAEARDSINALSRALTEKFDFVVVASQELGPLSGSALIATLKLSSGASAQSKTILLSSNTQLTEPVELQPDVVIKKDAKLVYNLEQSIMLLGLKNAA